MRIKASSIKEHRERLLHEQGGLCALRRKELLTEDAVLDHCHRTGLLRASIHRSCNSGLGAVERVTRYGVKDVLGFAIGAAEYLKWHTEDRTGLLHPTHKSTDEKKALQKKRRTRKKLKI